jgi:hypothetical protein
MNANGLYSGVEGYIIPGTNSGVIPGVANGLYGEPDNVVSIVRDSLRIYLDPYNYEIGSSTWNDLSGNGSNATLVNSPVYDRTLGGRFICNRGGPTNQYISIPPPGTNGNISVSLWVKFNGTFGNSQVVLEYGGSGSYPFRILETASGTLLSVTIGIGPSIETTRFINDRWYNFTLVRQGTAGDANGGGFIYLDGNLIFSYTGASTTRTDFLNLNASGGGASHAINNEYGVFLFYNKPLTPSEVKQNYFALKKRYNIL